MTVNWLDPQPFGVDAFGNTHHLQTVGTHTVFGGKTGCGKTDAALGFVGMGLLDPKFRPVVIDGKDDDDQWRQIEEFTGGMYVGGNTSSSVAAVERLLHDLDDISNSRSSGDKGASEPMAVVVDEWYRIRQAAKRHAEDKGKVMDGLMADFASSCRSRHIHLIFCVQAGTVEFLPGDLGVNLGQRVQGWAATPAQIRYLIHSKPDIEPSRPGEFLVSSDEGGSSELVTAPFFGDAQDVVYAAARRIRAPRTVDLRKTERAPEEPATWQELVEVILAEAHEVLTTSSIHAALGAAAPTPTPERFGRLLTADAQSELPAVMAARTRRGTRGWTLADSVLPAQGEYIGSDPRSETLTDRLLALGGAA